MAEKKKPKIQLKKAEDFTQEDIQNIIEWGKEKYTINEISTKFGLNKKGITDVLNKHNIKITKKPNNLQRLYSQNKLDSDQFYIECTSLIKSRLMPDLIYKGYFKDGKRQISYGLEEVDDCFTYVYGKILEKYDPKLGTLATFIRNWVRGYGTTVTTAQHRRYNKVGNDSSLDESYNNSIRDEFRDSFSYDELEESIDYNYFREDKKAGAVLVKDMHKLKDRYFKTMLKGLGEN
jgi:hypothetical protein